MKINRNNYEVYFLDYHEGNLKGMETEELFAFLDANPDLADEFNSFELITLNESAMEGFPMKDSLKKNTISATNCQDYLIAFVEGDLNEREIKEVNYFLKTNPYFQRELDMLKKTKLVPDKSIQYFGKSSLKKKEKRIIPMLYRYLSVAASVLIIIGVYFYSNKFKKDEHTNLYSHYTTVPITKDTTPNKVVEMPVATAVKGTLKNTAQPLIHNKIPINPVIQKPVIANDNSSMIVYSPYLEKIENIPLAINNFIHDEVPDMKLTPRDCRDIKIEKAYVSSQEASDEIEDNPIIKPAQYLKKLSRKEIEKLAVENDALTILIDDKKKGSRKFWDIASIEIGKLSGDRITFYPSYDKNDKMTSYHIAAGPVSISK